LPVPKAPVIATIGFKEGAKEIIYPSSVGTALLTGPLGLGVFSYKKYKEDVPKAVDTLFPESADVGLKNLRGLLSERGLLLKPFGVKGTPYESINQTNYNKENNPSQGRQYNTISQGKLTKDSPFINVPKRLGYDVLAAGTEVTRQVYAFGKEGLKRPVETFIALELLGGLASKVATKSPFLARYGVPTAFVGVSALTAPQGERVITSIGTLGFFGALEGTRKLPRPTFEVLKVEAKGGLEVVTGNSVKLRGKYEPIGRKTELPKEIKPIEGKPVINEVVKRDRQIPD